MHRYHNNSGQVVVAASGGTTTITLSPEGSPGENFALWLMCNKDVDWKIQYTWDVLPAADVSGASGTYPHSTSKKVWTEAGPLPLDKITVSAVLTNNNNTDIKVNFAFLALMRQTNG